MPLPPDRAWFPAKTYGYGWGPPRRWQGWLVLVLYVGALIAGTGLIHHRNVGLFIGWVFVVSAVLTAVCWWKGESAAWRWGDPPPTASPRPPRPLP